MPNEEQVEQGPDGMLLITDCETGKCKCTNPPGMGAETAQQDEAADSLERGGLKVSVRAIRDAGYRVDRDLWPAGAAADCTQCHTGCTDSPTR